MAWFLREVHASGKTWERRFAKRFALAYAGVRLAIEFGLLPWTWRQAFDAVALCYRAARGATPDTEARVEEALARLRQALGGKGKLVDLRPTAGKRPSIEQLKAAAGCSKSDPRAGDYVAVKREVFEAAVGPSLPVALMLERLQ